MSRVKGQDTRPEKMVRTVLHKMGYRFRLHRSDLPGKPDIVLPKHRKVIFIHGCFWHAHANCKRAGRPTTNTVFWDKKIDGNIKRDRRVVRKLKATGWNVLVVWQCQIVDRERLVRRLEQFVEK